MSEAVKFKDYLKSLTLETNSIGLKVMSSDFEGNVHMLSRQFFGFKSLTNAETAKSTISLLDFVKKYVVDLPVGFKLTDGANSYAMEWYVALTDTLKVSTQRYCIEVLKHSGNLDYAWQVISLLFMPITSADKGYIVSIGTSESVTAISTTIKEFAVTSWGGVKRFASVGYKLPTFLKEGGSPYERGDDSELCGDNSASPGWYDDAEEWLCVEFRRDYHDRYLSGERHCRRGVCGLSSGRVPIRESRGIWWPNLYRAAVSSASTEGWIHILPKDTVYQYDRDKKLDHLAGHIWNGADLVTYDRKEVVAA